MVLLLMYMYNMHNYFFCLFSMYVYFTYDRIHTDNDKNVLTNRTAG